ncbi:TPA: hypothetical protein DD425_01700 [Candidatus Saccharibacteria bacterium]|nr:hypothetical protein [Candidatus Saccharibacteria bacterium]
MHPIFIAMLIGASTAYVVCGAAFVFGAKAFMRTQYNATQDEIRWMPQWKQVLVWPFLLYAWDVSQPEVGYLSRETAWQAQVLLTERNCPDADSISEGHLPPMDTYRELGGAAFNVTAHRSEK